MSTVNSGQLSVDGGWSMVDGRQWTVNGGQWTVDSQWSTWASADGQMWTLDCVSVDAARCATVDNVDTLTVDSGWSMIDD